MIPILLDSNIYDLLAKDKNTCNLIDSLSRTRKLKIIVTRTVAKEIQRGPMVYMLQRFPVEFIGNTVARAGIMCAGDSLGGGEIFDKHYGDSSSAKNLDDAFIADAASLHADWLVSEDKRMRNQIGRLDIRCKAMTYAEFLVALASLQP